MARSRIALGLAVLLTVKAVYTHTAAVVARRELLQPSEQAPVGAATGPADVTFKVLPPVPLEDPGFFEVLDLTLIPEASGPPSEGAAPEVPLDLPPEAALGPETFTDPGNEAAYVTIEGASKEIKTTAVAIDAIGRGSPEIDTISKAAQGVSITHLADMTRLIGGSPTDNQEFQAAIENVAAQWELVLRSAVGPPTQVGPFPGFTVALPPNADPTKLNQLQLWEYYYNALVVPALTALTDYLADPSDTAYQNAFIAAAAQTSGAGSGPDSQTWSVSLAASQLLNYMAVVTNPAGSCTTSPQITLAADGVPMCLFQNSAGLGALLEYDRQQYVYIVQYLFSTAVLTVNVAAASEGIVNAVVNGGDQATYNLNIRDYQSWYQAIVGNIYAFYEDMATYFWNNQFRTDISSAINYGNNNGLSSAEVSQNLLGFLNQKYDFLVWNGFVFTAPGLYSPSAGQVWAQVGGCMAGRMGIDTLWLPYNPTTCSTAGGSIFYPDYPLQNGTNIGYVLFWNAAGENSLLPGDNDKITAIARGCQGSTNADPQSIVNCVSTAYPDRGIIALNPGNNVPDPSDYAAGSYAAYIFFSNLPASGNDPIGTTLALLPQP